MFQHWETSPKQRNKHYLTLSYIRRSLWMFAPKLKSRKKNCTFFSLNLFSIPRDIPWHHWKNLLTSKRGRSGGLNFFTKFAQILLKTSGGSRNLNFDPICKCHTILETSWCPYEALHNLIDLQGHYRPPEAVKVWKSWCHNFFHYGPMDSKL